MMWENPVREEVIAVIEYAVDNLLEDAGVAEPPVDAIQLAQNHLKMAVCVDDRQAHRGRAQRLAGNKHIFLRPEPSYERHQWTVAHEIGEHLKTKLLERLDSFEEPAGAWVGESLANLFAGHLLVPTRWLARAAAACRFDLLDLKKRFSTASHEVVAFRLLALPEPCVITVVDNNHIYQRRSNAWPAPQQLNAAERQCQDYVNYFSRPHRVRTEGWTVQGWPVHQSDWKREILRSVKDDDWELENEEAP